MDETSKMILTILGILGGCIWLLIGMRSTIEIKELKTSLSKYLDKSNIIGRWNLLFFIAGPLVLLDITYTNKLKRIAQEKRNKYILDNSKFKIGDLVSINLHDKIPVKAQIRKIDMGYNNELNYYVAIFLNKENEIDWSAPIKERNIKRDRKSRIDKIYGN